MRALSSRLGGHASGSRYVEWRSLTFDGLRHEVSFTGVEREAFHVLSRGWEAESPRLYGQVLADLTGSFDGERLTIEALTIVD